MKLTLPAVIHNVQLIHDAVVSADVRTGCTSAPWSRATVGLTVNELTGLNNNCREMLTNLDKQKHTFTVATCWLRVAA